MSATIETELWTRLAAPVPAGAIEWRQDGAAKARGSQWFARFVPYVDAQFVRERLDAVASGQWTLALTPLGESHDREGGAVEAFKCTLTIAGVSREDVGDGADLKSAATDAFKRAAMRFGIGSDLYGYEQNWVQVESEKKYAKPLQDPQQVYEKRHGAPTATRASTPAPTPPAPPKSPPVIDPRIPRGAAAPPTRQQQGAVLTPKTQPAPPPLDDADCPF